MEINYKITRKELVNFHMSHIKETKIFRCYCIFIYLIILASTIGAYVKLKKYDITGIFAVIIVFLVLAIISKILAKFVFRIAFIFKYKTKSCNSCFYPTKLILCEDYLNLITELDEKHFKWATLQSLCFIDDFIFITTFSQSNITIPVSAFESPGAKHAFLNSILHSTNLLLKYNFPTNSL